MSVKTARRIRPFLVALVIGLGFPALAFAEAPVPQTTDEATQDTDETQQQAAQGDEQRKRPDGKVKPKEAQKDQDSSLSHDTDEESLDQESGSDAMMQPDGYNGG